jgi:bifunctional non-homologous end joining protein LigD
MMGKVKKLLSEITGVELKQEEPEPEPVKMNSKAWNKAKEAIAQVFEELSRMNIIALADAGYTQSDAFADCSEIFHERNDNKDIIGFCFYTRQDLNTAKRSSELYLGIWGAPDGKDDDIIAVGKLVISAFEKHSFQTNWNVTASTRPCVLLYNFNS